MRVVVAGSTGLIGTSLIPALRQADHEVLRLVRRTPQAPDERGWSPVEGHIDEDALRGADAVINLCGAGVGDKRWNPERKAVLRRSRIEPTALLARAAAEHGVGTLINASATGYYGDRGETALIESTPPGSGFLADLCRDWEDATRPASEAGVRAVLLRTGLVLSPSGGLLGQLKPLFAMMLGGRLGDGRQYMPWISLDDEISAICFALHEPDVSGPLNLSGPAPVTNSEFTSALSEAIGRPAPWIVPGFVLRAALGEFADEGVLASQRVCPTVLEKHGFTFQHPTVRTALATAIPS
ncbi:TIGR01777 family oxidoreductase [Parasphingorhabdus pacifica]